MCGVGKKCNELLTDIFNRGNRNWIWPHFPSVRVSYIRADKADEVQLSGRKLTLNYVYQWEMLLLNSSELIQRLFLFFLHTKEKWLSRVEVKKGCPSTSLGLRTRLIQQPCPAQSRTEESDSHEAFPASWILLHLLVYSYQKQIWLTLAFLQI